MNRLAARATSLWAHTGFQKYFKNTSWILGTRILTMGMSFLAMLFIARTLGPTNFGQLSYAMSYVALFGFLATLGMDTVVYRDIVRYKERAAEILGTTFCIRLISATTTAVIATGLAFVLLKDDVSSILILILSAAFITNSFQIILFAFQARAESKYPSYITFGIALILNVAKVTVIVMHKGIIYLALVQLFESLLYMIAYIYIYYYAYGATLLEWRFSKTYARSLLRDSVPLIALSAFTIVYARIDQVLIRHLIDAAAVGIYDAAVRVAEVWAFIPGILLAALAPALVNAKLVSQTEYFRRLFRLALVFLFLAVMVSLVITVAAPFIMDLLYGPAFAGGVIILRIYIWAFVGTSLDIVITQYLIIENNRRVLASIGFIPMVLNIVLNLLWIPRYGIEGSAYATLVSYMTIPFMLLLFKATRHDVVAMARTFRISKI